jgi:hypothetical protein
MGKSAVVKALVVLLLCQGVAAAQPPVDAADIEDVILDTYVHFFVMKQIFEECAAISPEQRAAFQKAISLWEERNEGEWRLIQRSLAKHLVARPTEYTELVDALPGLAKQQYREAPFSGETCESTLALINTIRFWDYSVKFPEHMKTLEAKFGEKPV